MTLGPPHAGHEPNAGAVTQRNLEHARRNGWPRLELEDLDFGPFGTITHKPSGKLYHRHRGLPVDALYISATAYSLTDDDELIFFESPPPGSPQTVAELEERQARRGR